MATVYRQCPERNRIRGRDSGGRRSRCITNDQRESGQKWRAFRLDSCRSRQGHHSPGSNRPGRSVEESLYGETKTWAEQHLLENNTTIGYRFATAFGVSPRLRLDLLINDFTYKALTEGYLIVYEKHFMRTFIHVHDMGRAFIFAIENIDKMKNNIYNIGSSKMNYSKKNICEMIKYNTNAFVHYADVGEDVDKRNYVVSYERINSLGFDTTISVEEGINELTNALKAIKIHVPYTNI